MAYLFLVQQVMSIRLPSNKKKNAYYGYLQNFNKILIIYKRIQDLEKLLAHAHLWVEYLILHVKCTFENCAKITSNVAQISFCCCNWTTNWWKRTKFSQFYDTHIQVFDSICRTSISLENCVSESVLPIPWSQYASTPEPTLYRHCTPELKSFFLPSASTKIICIFCLEVPSTVFQFAGID